MKQTAYTPISNLYSKLPYIGGLCKFWYIPVQHVASIPNINPVNSYLLAEPVLISGKTWYGPVPVPDRSLGYTETQENSTAGHYYKLKIAGNHYGDAPQSRVNIENLTYHKYLVIGKQRAGGFYLLFGTLDSPLNFDNEFTAGQNGANDTAHTKLAFTTSIMHKALVLPSFLGDPSQLIYPGGGSGGGGGVHTNETEIIYITNESSKSFTYTTARRNRFGDFPQVECWLQGPDGVNYLSPTQPYIDAPPPGFTTMFYEFPSNVTGFIVLK